MSYPSEWWNKPLDPYKDGRIYLSDGEISTDWYYKEQGGDPSKVITYEEWKLIPKNVEKIEPLPFMMSNRATHEVQMQALDKMNDRHIHYGL